MRFEVDSGGRRLTIDVERSTSGWAVAVNGRRKAVALARAGDRWSMLLSPPDAADDGPGSPVSASYDVAVEAAGRGRVLVHVGGRVIPVVRLDPRAARRAPAEGSTGGPAAAVSPMPGRVVKVLVARGDRVMAGQGLVVVEAMKMENEIRARHAGTVTEVHVREGEPVEAGAVLLTIAV